MSRALTHYTPLEQCTAQKQTGHERTHPQEGERLKERKQVGVHEGHRVLLGDQKVLQLEGIGGCSILYLNGKDRKCYECFTTILKN